MRLAAHLLIFATLLSGCVGPHSMDAPEPSFRIDDGWSVAFPGGSARYGNGSLHIAGDGDSVSFLFEAPAELILQPLRLRFDARLAPDAHLRERVFTFALWNITDESLESGLWTGSTGEYAYVGAAAAGGEIVRLWDPQGAVVDSTSYSIGVESLEPVVLPAGHYGVLVGGAPFVSYELTLDLPPNRLSATAIRSGPGCDVVSMSEFESFATAWLIMGPHVIVEGEHEFSTPGGMFAAIYDATILAGPRNIRLVLPDGSVQARDHLVNPSGEFVGGISAFYPTLAGTYTLRLDSVAALGGQTWLMYCGIAPYALQTGRSDPAPALASMN